MHNLAPSHRRLRPEARCGLWKGPKGDRKKQGFPGHRAALDNVSRGQGREQKELHHRNRDVADVCLCLRRRV